MENACPYFNERYGIGGAQWILENYGIGLGDFQGVAMKYLERNTLKNSQQNKAEM
jgi:hypothetical protein